MVKFIDDDFAKLVAERDALLHKLKVRDDECEQLHATALDEALIALGRERKSVDELSLHCQDLARALTLAMIPLEALRMSVEWELADAIKQAIKEAVDNGRAVLGIGQKIPSADLNRVNELRELEKTRPITDEELDSCVTQRVLTEQEIFDLNQKALLYMSDVPEATDE